MNQDIAVVGLSVDVPGATDLDSFWQVVSTGTSMSRPFPPDRAEKLAEYIRYQRATSIDPLDEPDIDYHNGYFLDVVDHFDHAAFGMNPRQATLTDPHHRMVLRAMYLAFEDAGYSLDRLRGSRTGVFVGFAVNPGSTYLDYISRVDPSVGQQAITGNIPVMLANRLSHHLDLRGPSMVVDTACSATLVAVHQAKNALLVGDCDMAVVGGARIVFAPVKHRHSDIGIESSDGVTRTFDEAADGTGFGEGSGAVVLKRLDKALADGDQVYAVVKGSAVNHDGNTEGITNPDSDSQADLLLAAWDNAGVDPRTIGYFEAHGTATRVGDPVEHEGMKRAFAKHTADRGFCAVGTVKANVGHLFEGSGVIGLIKAIAVLRNKAIPPQANYANPNPKLDFASGPLYVPTELTPWEPDGPRRAGVSAFGLGGANAHVVVEEFTPVDDRPASTGEHLFTLSAATVKSLIRLVERYVRFIDAGGLAGVDIADVCHTTQVSRGSHRHRVAVTTTDAADLRHKLVELLAERPAPLPDGPLGDQGRAFLRGGRVDWRSLAGDRRPRIVRLPSYAFDETLAWVQFPDDWRETMNIATTDERHPVTHDVEFQETAPAEPTGRATTVLALVDPDTDAEAVLTAARLGDVRYLRLGEDLEPGTPFDPTDPAAHEHVARLVGDGVTHLVHALAFEDAPATDVAEVERRTEKNLNSLFLLTKALMAAGVKVDLAVLTKGAVCAADGDPAVVENAALVGFGKVVGREYPYIKVKHVDVDPAVPPAALRAEVLADQHGVFLLRGDKRLREVFVEVPEVTGQEARDYLKPDGTYLVTGGTGALGLAVAKDFATARPGVTLALLSRSGVPPRERWDDLTAVPTGSTAAKRVEAVRELEALGATVVVLAADAGDPDSLAAAVTALRRDHGRIDGIVHAAGLPGGSTVMFRRTEDFDRVVRAKLHAAFVLDELTADDRPDFVAHFSSVASVFPAPGQADYAAANYYLDNLARHRAGGPTHVIALDWVAWKEIGMAVDFGTNGDTMFKALPTKVGLSVLDAGLRSTRARLFAGELNYRGELIHLLRSYDVALSPDIEAKVEKEMQALEARLLKASEKTRATVAAVSVELEGRPGGDYSDVERTVAQCLALAFGYETLDVEADFFDLGGDSIMAATVANTIAVCHGVGYDVADLLADRTVAEIAYHVEDLADFAATEVA
ncbi:SDR family NAD(P)-dependent oxidoreductase [Saccharothrix longispora]|uniref:Acyl transferase domain-containing protein n=1 Tax=Saccharothrix longispora TaxID=33920 RepID=A0ABU1PUT3_9PSEU|nr:SDR family NAD(P)-dependent oxidoreductase [Saccharothrix longispora]MDR6593904.1 acyl transferase domain-containing protein [Saccharothrix longispora]